MSDSRQPSFNTVVIINTEILERLNLTALKKITDARREDKASKGAMNYVTVLSARVRVPKVFIILMPCYLFLEVIR